MASGGRWKSNSPVDLISSLAPSADTLPNRRLNSEVGAQAARLPFVRPLDSNERQANRFRSQSFRWEKLVNVIGETIMPRVSLAASQKLESEGLSMRKTSCLPRLWIFSLSVLLFSATLCLGQNREKFVISAKAGGINAVTGQASVVGKGEAEWQQLMVTDDLKAGDRVK